MKINSIFGVIALSTIVIASCESPAATVEEKVEDKIEEVNVEVLTMSVDSSQSIVNWRGYESPTDPNEFHEGTVKFLDGSVTISEENGALTITEGTVNVDMNSIKESQELTDLEAHLKSGDFFDVNQFAAASFKLESHTGDMITGTATIIGKEFPVEANVTVSKTEVTVSSFRIDMSGAEMPFFVADMKQAPEKQHDPNLEFNVKLVLK